MHVSDRITSLACTDPVPNKEKGEGRVFINRKLTQTQRIESIQKENLEWQIGIKSFHILSK